MNVNDGGGSGSSGKAGALDALPLIDDGEAIRTAVTVMNKAAGGVLSHASATKKHWGNLAAVYHAPEQHLVLTAMNKPENRARDLKTDIGTAATALNTYAGECDRLKVIRDQPQIDVTGYYADKARIQREHPEDGSHQIDLLNDENALLGRLEDLQVALDRAQRTCRNVISHLTGTATFEAVGETDVNDTTVYGFTKDGYHQLTRMDTGILAWQAPEMWRDWHPSVVNMRKGQGIIENIEGYITSIGALYGWQGEGAKKAASSGLLQSGKDFFRTGMLFTPAGALDPKNLESGRRVLEMFKGMSPHTTMKNDPHGTMGGLSFDLVTLVLSGGAGGVTKTILQMALKSMVRRAPLVATTVSTLAKAEQVWKASATSLKVETMTSFRDLGYRAADHAAKTRATVGGSLEQMRDQIPSGASSAPRVATVGGPDHGWTRPDSGDSGTMYKKAHPAGWGWSGQNGPSHNDGEIVSPPRSSYQGGDSGILGNPSKEHYAHKNIDFDTKVRDHETGLERKVMPKAGTAFGSDPSVKLEPFTRYEVRGRGTFYTDAKGHVEFVDPARYRDGRGVKMSTDLRNPLPNVTYRIDGVHLHTNEHGLTDHVHVDEAVLSPETKASDAAKRAVTHVPNEQGVRVRLKDTDAGHLLQRLLGGPREEINLVRMVSDFNQGHNGRNLMGGDSYRHVEMELEKAFRERPNEHLTIDIRVNYPELDDTQLRSRHIPPTDFIVKAVRPDGTVVVNAPLENL